MKKLFRAVGTKTIYPTLTAALAFGTSIALYSYPHMGV